MHSQIIVRRDAHWDHVSNHEWEHVDWTEWWDSSYAVVAPRTAGNIQTTLMQDTELHSIALSLFYFIPYLIEFWLESRSQSPSYRVYYLNETVGHVYKVVHTVNLLQALTDMQYNTATTSAAFHVLWQKNTVWKYWHATLRARWWCKRQAIWCWDQRSTSAD